MESASYGIYALVVFVTEISLVRYAHSFDFWCVKNSCVNIVRLHFPRSLLYIYTSLTNSSKVVLRCVVRFVHHSSRTWTGDKVWPPCIDPAAAKPTTDLRLLKVAEWDVWQRRRTVVKNTMANALRFIFAVKGYKRSMISKSVMDQTILHWWVTEGNCSR